MKILFAPAPFKDSLTAETAAETMARGFSGVLKGLEVELMPIADGGEGTVKTLVRALDGEFVLSEASDPLGRKMTATWGLIKGGKTAVIEMSAASGLELLKEEERNPWHTTTRGTGEMIRAALDRGCREIIMGLGGSATVDGGLGMAATLGISFLDKSGKIVPEGGRGLSLIERIDTDRLDPRINKTKIRIACDVWNPLTGENGAARVFGPQKGAFPEMVAKLEQGLENLALRIKENTGKDISKIPGTGAAGGLGASLLAFMGAGIEEGFQLIAGITGLEERIRLADIVVTGEGRVDATTLDGKVVMGIGRMASKYGKKVLVLAGSVGAGAEGLLENGISKLVQVSPPGMPLREAISRAEELLELASRDTATKFTQT